MASESTRSLKVEFRSLCIYVLYVYVFLIAKQNLFFIVGLCHYAVKVAHEMKVHLQRQFFFLHTYILFTNLVGSEGREGYCRFG